MRKKLDTYAVLLYIAVFSIYPKVDGQCIRALEGTYWDSHWGGIGTLTIYKSDSSELYYSGAGGFYYTGFNCNNGTFGVSSGPGCEVALGTGTYSCDYNTIYIYCVVSDPGGPMGSFHDTLRRDKSIIISTTYACSGSNGIALAKLSGFSDNSLAKYSYRWSNGDTTNPATGLSAGAYTVTVITSYSDSCPSDTDTASAIIQYSSKPAINLQLIKDYEGNNSSIKAIASGGTSPYKYTWFPQDSSYNIATHLPAGFYLVIVTDSNNCANTDTVYITNIDTISITNYSTLVYPNPFHNFTTVSLIKAQKYVLEIDDMLGRKLRQIEFTGNQCQISASGLAKGMYFLRAFGDANSVVYTTKIVVQ